MKLLIVANWKMNPITLAEVKRIFSGISEGIKGIKNLEIAIAPPFVYLSDIKQFSNLTIKLGAQNCHWLEKGAFTGEVSPLMLKDVGCKYVILGHSERRAHFGETDEMINRKLAAALKAGLKPIFCFGENLEERKRGETKAILEKQLTLGLQGIARHWIRDIIFAYEPVWAISSFGGIAAHPDDVLRAGLLIKKIIAKMYGLKIVKDVFLLYGGSVNSKNACDFVQDAGMQGLVVGQASLNVTEFINIIKSLS